MKGEVEYLKNKFDKLKRTKRGITYINILHTLQKVERKLDKLERKLLDKLERKLLDKLERNTTQDPEKTTYNSEIKFFYNFLNCYVCAKTRNSVI